MGTFEPSYILFDGRKWLKQTNKPRADIQDFTVYEDMFAGMVLQEEEARNSLKAINQALQGSWTKSKNIIWTKSFQSFQNLR